jgi:hypothetical protein
LRVDKTGITSSKKDLKGGGDAVLREQKMIRYFLACIILALGAAHAASVSITSVTVDDMGTPSTSDDKIILNISTDITQSQAVKIRIYNPYNLATTSDTLSYWTDAAQPGHYAIPPASVSIPRFDGSNRDRIYSAYTVGLNQIFPPAYTYSSQPQFVTTFNLKYSTTFGLADRDETPFTPKWTKKGHSDDAILPVDTTDFGSQYTLINLDYAELVRTVAPPSHASEYDYVNYEGTGYYFSQCYLSGHKPNPDGSCDGNSWNGTASLLESSINSYANDGVAVFLYLLMYPSHSLDGNADVLKHPKYTDSATVINGIHSEGISAFNTSDAASSRKFRAVTEYLANRYKGKVAGYIVGQEINLHFHWYNRGILKNSSGVALDDDAHKAEALDTLLSEYSRTLRIANTAVQKYSKNAKVYTSLTTYWKNYYDDFAPPNKWSQFAPPKDFIDVLNTKIKANGDINWNLIYKTFARFSADNLRQPLGGPWNDDVDYHGSYNLYINNYAAWKACDFKWTGSCDHSSDVSANPRWVATSDYNTSPFITARNIKILPDFFKTPALLYKGSPRGIIMGDIGFPSCLQDTVPLGKYYRCYDPSEDPLYYVREDYMAAAVAYLYYKIANLDGIEGWTYYRRTDRGDAYDGVDHLGLGFIDKNAYRNPDGSFIVTKRKAWDLYAHANRVDWRKYFDKVLYVFSDTQHPSLQDPAYARTDLTSWDAVLEGQSSTGTHFIKNALTPTIQSPMLLSH